MTDSMLGESTERMLHYRIHLLRVIFKACFSYKKIIKGIRNPRAVFDLFEIFLNANSAKLSLNEAYEINYRSLVALYSLSTNFHTLSFNNVYDEYGEQAKSNDCKELEKLFSYYGSDKAIAHDYHLIYSALLQLKRSQAARILEIGLGTNNINIRSNMGRYGKPGASLRAFRDWGEQFQVYGADIDLDILFTESRIETFFVDQTSTEALGDLAKRFEPNSFDLIIDDGLHNPHANLNTLNFALKLVKDDGVIVIEDISYSNIMFWQLVSTILREKYKCIFLTARPVEACVFIVIKK